MADIERTCATCRHVIGGETYQGKVLTSQRCSVYRAGAHPMLTWTVTHNPKKCGPERVSWEAKPSTAAGVVLPEATSSETRNEGGQRG